MANDIATLQSAIIQVLKEDLAKHEISYRQLEERTGINTGTISKILNEKTSLRIETLDQLCDGIGTDIFSVVKRAKERTQ